MTKELELIVNCLDNINPKYFSEEITFKKNDVIHKTGGLRSNESTFVSQLIAKIESVFTSNNMHIDKFYQTDQPKQLIFNSLKFNENYSRTFNALFNPSEEEHNEFYKVPDIVIHAGPNDDKEHNQIFLAEVKTSFALSQKLFDIDFFKVNLYHEELKWQNAAFIIINLDLQKIRTRLVAYKRNRYYQSRRPGIYILAKPSSDSPTEVIDCL
ncbi:MAG: hypothetical protein KA163_05050 [Bacteroidia bacterium]|nr:hypothetical protein [Bacteroidia bacterium]